MSNLYIAEYAGMANGAGVGSAQIAMTPAITVQKVSFTGTAGQSAAFNANTRFVRLHTDGICSFRFGSDPTAVTTDPRMPADHTEYFGVTPGSKVSAITNT